MKYRPAGGTRFGLGGGADTISRMASTSTVGANLSHDSHNFYMSYLLTGDLSDLQGAVECAQEVFDHPPHDAPPMAMILFNLARPLVRRFLHARKVEDITKASQLFICATALSMSDIPMSKRCHAYMRFASLVQLGRLEGSIENGDLEVCTLESKDKREDEIIEFPPCKWGEDKEVFILYDSKMLVRLGRPEGSIENGDLEVCTPESKYKIEFFTRELGEDKEVFMYYDSKMSDDDLDTDFAIRLHQQALKFFSFPRAGAPPYHEITVLSLISLGHLLHKRYSIEEKLTDNDEAIAYFCRAFALPVTMSKRARHLVAASEALAQRFDVLRRREDLIKAITYAKQAMENCNYQHEDFLACLEHLSHVFSNSRLSPETIWVDLQFAIDVHRQALTFFSSASFESMETTPEARILISLGILHAFTHVSQSGRTDIEEAVDCFSEALKLPMTMFERIKCSVYAGRALIKQFEQDRRPEDLGGALSYANNTLKYCASEGECPIRAWTLRGEILHCQFEATGNMKDSDDAIAAVSQAIKIAEQEAIPSKGLPRVSLNHLFLSLAKFLEVRSGRTGKSEEMIFATETIKRALDLWPLHHPRRIRTLMVLSHHEIMLSGRLQNTEYRKRGLQHLVEARSLAAQGELGRLDHTLKYELAMTYAHRLSEMNMWDDVASILQSFSLPSHLMSHPVAHSYHMMLGQCHFQRWKHTHRREDIEEAITTAHYVVNLDSLNPSEMLLARMDLGRCLYFRFTSTNNKKDLQDAVRVLWEGFQISGGLPLARILLGQRAIEVLCELSDCDWDLAQRLSKDILEIFTTMTGRSLQWADKQFFLRACSYQISTYAAIAFQVGFSLFYIIDVFETCRGLILGQVIENWTDLAALKEVSPEKAQHFAALRDELTASIEPAGNLNMAMMVMNVTDSVRRHHAEAEFRACLEDIRKLEGFHQFLLGPSQSELEAAAVEGPILIVNVTSIRSDAIILTKDACVSLELPGLNHDKVAEFQQAVQSDFSNLLSHGKANKKYAKLLAWLWNNCVKLIFEKLDDLIPGIAKFQVWWIGIGIASSLPFHAAGIYSQNLRESALDRAISSYSPTLKILIHSRHKLKIKQLRQDQQRTQIKPKLLIVTMPSTPGNSNLDLPGVEIESQQVQRIVKDLYHIQTSSHPSVRDIKRFMEECEAVHFACHGQVIFQDPASSHLLLQTTGPPSMTPEVDKLTVKDVAALNFNHGKLAFLSACSTADNPDSDLWDESLHLASAFHIAGYLHTVGNLWLADDAVSGEIVEGFYQHLFTAGVLNDGENVAEALNKTLIDMSKKLPLQPLSWAQYVHFGV